MDGLLNIFLDWSF